MAPLAVSAARRPGVADGHNQGGVSANVTLHYSGGLTFPACSLCTHKVPKFSENTPEFKHSLGCRQKDDKQQFREVECRPARRLFREKEPGGVRIIMHSKLSATPQIKFRPRPHFQRLLIALFSQHPVAPSSSGVSGHWHILIWCTPDNCKTINMILAQKGQKLAMQKIAWSGT